MPDVAMRPGETIAANSAIFWSEMPSCEHLVQFYDDEPALIEQLVEDDFADTVLDRDAFTALLAGSAERDREVLALRYGADLAAEEIAQLLDLSANNVHQIASRALRKLRSALADQAASGSA